MSGDQIHRAIHAEFERLGLDAQDLPGDGLLVGEGGAELLLDRLRRLAPGATWHDIFPDLAHWTPGHPGIWSGPR